MSGMSLPGIPVSMIAQEGPVQFCGHVFGNISQYKHRSLPMTSFAIPRNDCSNRHSTAFFADSWFVSHTEKGRSIARPCVVHLKNARAVDVLDHPNLDVICCYKESLREPPGVEIGPAATVDKKVTDD